MRRPAIGLLLAVATFVCASRAHGRQIEIWSYERLMKEADVVVIATATGTAESSERTATDNPWKTAFVGLDTSFEVHVVVKGKPEAGVLKVLHFRAPDDGRLFQNGPMLVTFRTKGISIETREAKVMTATPQYLLFLKRGPTGRYEPVSGRIDPALSVREIFPPLPDVLDNAAEGRQKRIQN